MSAVNVHNRIVWKDVGQTNSIATIAGIIVAMMIYTTCTSNEQQTKFYTWTT